jgi:hypothetical protein
MNTYLIVCAETGRSAIVDPGADGRRSWHWRRGLGGKILITPGISIMSMLCRW